MAGVSARYRIVRRFGQGGMAEVFEAELLGELGFVRRVAIKQLLAEALHDPIAGRRFVEESRIASRLHHANIVGVLDVGVLEDRPFQVLELVDGLDAQALAQRAGGALPVELALMLAHAVAHALDHAHAATGDDGAALGIVHRDVKPPNVLIGWNGDVKLADFGIAVTRDRIAHTETGAVAGTRGFIAPEQRLRGTLDGRSDVFALGLTLHMLCTGATPLADITAEARLLGGEPLVLDPALPDDVRAIIGRAVAPDRRDRPSAGELAEAIDGALAARDARDPRSAIRAYLAGFRTPPRKPGALDRLLGVELLAIADEDGVRRYATQAPRGDRADPAMAERAMADQAMAERVPTATTTLDAVTQRRPGILRRRTIIVVGGAALVAAIAIAAAVRPGATPITARRDAAAAIASPPIDAALASDAAASPEATIAATIAAIPEATNTAVGKSGGPGALDARDKIPEATVDAAIALAPPDAGSPPAATHRRRPPAPLPAPAPVGRGYVQVVGEDLLRARVLIDGVAVGFVPNRFEVALGHHRVEVERPDGVRLPARELDVTSFHTARNPARPAW